MDNLPDPVLSPSKAAQAASLSIAWSEVTHFLTPLFHPYPIPTFERNPATLNALLQLSSHSTAQTDRNALLAQTRAIALRELQFSLPTTSTSDEQDDNSETGNNNNNNNNNANNKDIHRSTAAETDPALVVLASIASSLPPAALSALHTLSALAPALNALLPSTPDTMALSLAQLTRAESETAQQLARVESLHQQLKSEHVLAQELLDKLRGESSSSATMTSNTAPSGSGNGGQFQTPAGLMAKTGEWQRGSKQLGTKLGEYRERARRLEKSVGYSGPRGNHRHPRGAHGKGGNTGSIGIPELRVEERELRDLEARVRGLEGRVRGFEGLPPDKEMALLEVERMRRELEGLVRKRDGMFEGLVERGE